MFFEFHDECWVSCVVYLEQVCPSLFHGFVVVPTADSPLDSGDIAGMDADASGFTVAADLSSLRCLRFLRSDFPDEVCTIYDLGSTHLSVTTAGDHLLESGSYTRTRCPSSMFGRSRCAGYVETFGMTAIDSGGLLFFLFGLHCWGTLLVSFP